MSASPTQRRSFAHTGQPSPAPRVRGGKRRVTGKTQAHSLANRAAMSSPIRLESNIANRRDNSRPRFRRFLGVHNAHDASCGGHCEPSRRRSVREGTGASPGGRDGGCRFSAQNRTSVAETRRRWTRAAARLQGPSRAYSRGSPCGADGGGSVGVPLRRPRRSRRMRRTLMRQRDALRYDAVAAASGG